MICVKNHTDKAGSFKGMSNQWLHFLGHPVCTVQGGPN